MGQGGRKGKTNARAESERYRFPRAGPSGGPPWHPQGRKEKISGIKSNQIKSLRVALLRLLFERKEKKKQKSLNMCFSVRGQVGNGYRRSCHVKTIKAPATRACLKPVIPLLTREHTDRDPDEWIRGSKNRDQKQCFELRHERDGHTAVESVPVSTEEARSHTHRKGLKKRNSDLLTLEPWQRTGRLYPDLG